MTDSAPAADRLRVLFLATYFPKPQNPLMGNWALQQAQAIRRSGVDIRVVSFTSWVPRIIARSKGAAAYANCPHEYSWDGLEVLYPRWLYYPVSVAKRQAYRWPQPQMAIAWATARRTLLTQVQHFRPDVIFCHHTAVNGFLGMRIRELEGLPFVVTDHDFGEIADCEIYPARRRFFSEIVAQASSNVCVSHRMERDMRRLFPEARVLTVHNGTDPIAPEIATRPRPAERERKVVVFSAGAFYTRKGFPLLIDAFARVAKDYPDAILRIAGDGEEREKVEQAVRQSGVADRIQLLGFQSHDQVLQELVWCDVFALVGWDEPFATVFLEAAAAGRPVVWAKDGGINDVLIDQQHGLSVEPRDVDSAAAALRTLLSDAGRRAEMGRSILSLHREKLTWDANAAAMIRLFEAARSSGARR
jgi:glycosyltransferase involved in cell wall biosynthesis